MSNGTNVLDLPYPVWAEVLPASGASSSGASGEASSIAAGGKALASISDVLAWRVRPGDAAGIKRALLQAFPIETNAAGKRVMTWRPRGYRAQSVEAGIGAITGPQLSIYERTKTIVDQTRALLDELGSLVPAPDEEDVAAVEALILPQLSDLVDQFGAEGGPMPQRVDSVFELLFGIQLQPGAVYTFQNPDDVDGLLGLLRDRLGLVGKHVNTIDEEKLLTKFHLIVNYIDMLMLSWQAQRGSMDRSGTDVFFGTQIVRLQRVFSVIAESVIEIYRAMDSVFLGPAERLTLELHTDPRITVAELLNWIDELATTRAFDILTEGGKDGAEHALVPTLERVNELFISMTDDAENFEDYADAFRTARVQSAVSEMRTHLTTALQLAMDIRRTTATPPPSAPQLISLEPSGTLPGGASVTFRINVKDVPDSAAVHLVNSTTGTATTLAPASIFRGGENLLIATFDLPDTKSTGWKLRITDGNTVLTSRETIDIEPDIDPTAQPDITSIAPDTVRAPGSVKVTITGTGFNKARLHRVRLKTVHEIPIESQTDKQIVATIHLPPMHGGGQSPLGWSLRVTNGNGKKDSFPLKIDRM